MASLSNMMKKNGTTPYSQISRTGSRLEKEIIMAENIVRPEEVDIRKCFQAPAEINKFDPVRPEKRLEIKLSIIECGVIQPLHLWEQEDGKFMVLAGNNRLDILNELYEETGDEKYLKAPAVIYPYLKLKDDESMIEQIVFETNLLGREKLTRREQNAIAVYEMKKFKRQKTQDGKNIGELCKELGMEKSRLYEIWKMEKCVIPEILEFYYTGELKHKTLVRISKLNEELQEYIYNIHEEKKVLTNNLQKLPKEIETIEQFEEYIRIEEESKNCTYKNIEFQVPEEFSKELEKEIQEFIKEWLQNKN